MSLRLSLSLCLLILPLGLAATPLRAAEPGSDPGATAGDPDLPQALDEAAAEQLLSSSPFTRILNLSDQLILTGVAYIEGKPVATILDKATKKSYVVSDQPNALGWKLANTSASKELKRTEVQIMVGGEVATIRYADQQLAPELAKKSRSGSSGSDVYVRDGKSYMKSTPYMTDEQRDRYHALPNEVRDKWRAIMQANTEKLMAAPQEEREAFVKRNFEKFTAREAAAAGKK